jgi:glycosyltransferase involved in cell wall biosynthesis
MPDAPRFSVTVPAYNAETTLAETIESVQAQTFGDWELVIVDDGSTDGTRALAERFAAANPRIRVVSQENRGSGGAYNTAVRNARADLLVMLSADDLLLPDHLAEFDAFISMHPDASIFSSTGYYEYEDDARELSDLHTKWSDPARCEMRDLLRACFFGIGAVYRRDVFDAVGGFQEDIYAEDYPFWLMAFARGFNHRYLDRPLAVHRRNSMQKSADALRVREADLRAVKELVATGLLGPDDLAVAKRTVTRLQANILVRKTSAAVLGNEATSRLIDRVRNRRR